MKPDKIPNNLNLIQEQLTLQTLAKHNRPLFIVSVLGLTGALVLATLCLMSGILHFSSFFLFLAGACIFAGIFFFSASLLLFGPKGVMAKKYSKQLEHQNLDELSEEEIHALIDYHRGQKNYDAAERASKYLMLKVEKNEPEV